MNDLIGIPICGLCYNSVDLKISDKCVKFDVRMRCVGLNMEMRRNILLGEYEMRVTQIDEFDHCWNKPLKPHLFVSDFVDPIDMDVSYSQMIEAIKSNNMVACISRWHLEKGRKMMFETLVRTSMLPKVILGVVAKYVMSDYSKLKVIRFELNREGKHYFLFENTLRMMSGCCGLSRGI